MSDPDFQREVTFSETPRPDGSIEITWECNTSRDWHRILRLIKEAIPHGGRAWNPDTKMWVIGSSHIPLYENIKQAVISEDVEVVGELDEELNETVIANRMGTELDKLPRTMRPRALFAIRAVLGMIDAPVEFCISEQRFGAWSEEDNRWYYEDGRYSETSPTGRDDRAIARAYKRLNQALDTIGDAIEALDQERPESWRKKFRTNLLEKYGYMCYVCYRRPKNLSKLHMHRVIPGKDGGEYIEDNVVILCVNCHRQYEGDSWQDIHKAHEINQRHDL